MRGALKFSLSAWPHIGYLFRVAEHHAAFRPRRLGHANLFVADYLRAGEYYRSVAGLEEVYTQPDNRASFLSNGNTYHDVGLTDVTAPYAIAGQRPGLYHHAFEVATEAELVAGYTRAVNAGVKFSATKDHDVAHSLYLRDPDGQMLELYADVVKDWRSHRSGTVVKKKPQWIPGETNVPSEEHNYPQDPEICVVSDAIFHPKRATHVGIVARNFEAMLDFYVGVVGLLPFAGSADGAYAVLRGSEGPACALTLYRAHHGVAVGLHHVGFEVWDESDLEGSIDRLGAARLPTERLLEHPARRAVCVRDPDGILLQFYVNRDFSPDVVEGIDADSALYLL
jgi:catechol 2,3-dioxygenase